MAMTIAGLTADNLLTVKRPLADRLELVSPALTRALTRCTLALPAPIRRAILRDAFARAQEAFNRRDLEVVFAAFAPGVEYFPPPSLPGARRIEGRQEVLRYWEGIFERFDENRIENLELVESSRGTMQRTARLRHANTQTSEILEYEIRQTTEFGGGMITRQTNELVTER
jgi:ketosteroid isomerase-like protein